MSISPPSDIILDVARAADPRRVEAATAKLAALASGSGAAPADFGAMLASAAGAPAGSAPARARADTSALLPDHPGPARALSPYQKFEAVLLQTFVQEMLPKDSQLFGDAASADAYRGMMAEQLADALARSGRIGIAKMIEHAHGGKPAPATAAVAAPSPAGDA